MLDAWEIAELHFDLELLDLSFYPVTIKQLWFNSLLMTV